ncbi:MAG: hypothetical protein RL342_880, partial [Pseudomonadota bacterium]
MTALVCILMGCGIPTTARYIIMVPFVFVFSPSLLLVAKGFNGWDFAVTLTG